MTVISVIVGSTREGRFSEKPAHWILRHLKKRDGIDARLLDLRDFPMPFFDQSVSPATPGRPPYEHEVVKRWTAANRFDENALKRPPPGSVHSEPGGGNHFARTAEPVLVQITGIGPTDTRYVNPSDAPKTPDR